LFGGGSGAGVSIQPVAFLVVNQGDVKVINMEFDGAADRVVSMVPDVVEKISELFKKKDKKGKKTGKSDKSAADDEDIPSESGEDISEVADDDVIHF
ncbi:MAG: GerW family sporulation protein, partial [Lachnospiraceae bacterium]|nr:GerW family sporulation protein [Lachnospiraceae bacterium]